MRISRKEMPLGLNFVGIVDAKEGESIFNGQTVQFLDVTFQSEGGIKEKFKIKDTSKDANIIELLSVVGLMDGDSIEFDPETELIGAFCNIEIKTFERENFRNEKQKDGTWKPMLDEDGNKVPKYVQEKIGNDWVPVLDENGEPIRDTTTFRYIGSFTAQMPDQEDFDLEV